MRESTLLTREWVAEQQSYLDWDTQPSTFKHYPDFCYRVSLDSLPSLQWLAQARCVTEEYRISDKPYRRLNVPSAGNLHPIEMYVQIRNIAGLLSGIYHVDVLHRELVMIREIGAEGIEPYLDLSERFQGAVVILTLVPFRSFWKYGLRAWRYLYLDLGHQIHALCASIRHFGLSLTKMSGNEGINSILGMGEDEQVAAIYGVGEIGSRNAKKLQHPLMRVQPTDYVEISSGLEQCYRNAVRYTKIPETFEFEDFLQINQSRRSAREFNSSSVKDAVLETILMLDVPSSLEINAFVFQAHAMQIGWYRSGKCAVNENFVPEIIELLLNQRFVSGSNMVVLIHSEYFSAESHIEAGIYAQELYRICEHHSMGCSGIGAFYDNDALRWSDKPLLYAVAIGGKV